MQAAVKVAFTRADRLGAMGPHPRHQRVGAYAVILQEDRILLSRLAPRVTREELWTLPGGGIEHGEHPRDAAVREVHEETGLRAVVSEEARVYSAHMPESWRDGRAIDAHALRIVYDAWVPPESPPPRVVEVDGSTAESAWIPVADVLEGRRPVVSLVRDALADHRPARLQRVGAHALVRRGGAVLLSRVPSPQDPRTGCWSLPGGSVPHGERPASALARVVAERWGVPLAVQRLLDVHDVRVTGAAPSGRVEDLHGVQLVFEAEVDPAVEERVATTEDAGVAWVSEHDIAAGEVPVLELVPHALMLEEA